MWGIKGVHQVAIKIKVVKMVIKVALVGQVSVLQVVHAITVRSMGILGVIVKILMCHAALDSNSNATSTRS